MTFFYEHSHADVVANLALQISKWIVSAELRAIKVDYANTMSRSSFRLNVEHLRLLVVLEST